MNQTYINIFKYVIMSITKLYNYTVHVCQENIFLKQFQERNET